MPPLFQTRPLPHRRKPRVTPPPPDPAPAVVHVSVQNTADDGRFGWFFDHPFDDSGRGGWTAADFAMLTIDGAAPIALDEVIGAEGNLTLIYPFTTAASYAMLAQPPLLVFDVMPVTLTPPTGAVA